jgi:hypothetical protein
MPRTVLEEAIRSFTGDADLVLTVFGEPPDPHDFARRIFCSLLSRQKVSKNVSPPS